MIDIKINMVRWGVGEPEQMASIRIYNDGTGSRRRGNYKYEIKKTLGKMKSGELKNFPRQSYDVIELLRRVLNSNKKGA